MAAKKKSQAKTKKTSKMQQTHGKTEEFQPSTLEQIWGDDGFDKYNTLSEATYVDQLNGMSKSDMQAHATKVGVVPIDNVEIMKSKLIKEFTKHVNQYRRPSHAPNEIKMSKDLKDVLDEGK
jgi:hypothetical protein